MKKIIENKKGKGDVLGVILMVAITVAIAATAYIYVSGMIDRSDISEWEEVEFTGVLQGFWDCTSGDPIIIGGQQINNVTYVDENYLENFIGEDITLILGKNPEKEEYRYIRAYLN